jgi:hypothetical protein
MTEAQEGNQHEQGKGGQAGDGGNGEGHDLFPYLREGDYRPTVARAITMNMVKAARAETAATGT